MSDQSCGNCLRFANWGKTGNMYYDHEPDGVCTSPRPMIGQQPSREVKCSGGKNCPMWEKSNG